MPGACSQKRISSCLCAPKVNFYYNINRFQDCSTLLRCRYNPYKESVEYSEKIRAMLRPKVILLKTKLV